LHSLEWAAHHQEHEVRRPVLLSRHPRLEPPAQVEQLQMKSMAGRGGRMGTVVGTGTPGAGAGDEKSRSRPQSRARKRTKVRVTAFLKGTLLPGRRSDAVPL
jgi:hypothetical protein